MNFPFLYTTENLDSIDIEDFGNCCLELFNDIGYVWYLIIETNLGWSQIQWFGPVDIKDKTLLSYHFSYKYDYEEYKDTKLIKMIDRFINDPKKQITQIFFTNKEEAMSVLKNLHERN